MKQRNDARLEARGDGRFAVEGNLSFATVRTLWDQSRQSFANAPESIDIDFSAAGRADSAGLALLVAWTRWARMTTKSIRFINAPQQVMALAQANKLEYLLPLQTS